MIELAATRLLWPDGTLAPGTLTIDDGRIVAVGTPTGAAPDRLLAPGFVDLQVNGHGDIDVAEATGGDWERLDELLVAQGVTTWCPTVVTDEEGRTTAALDRIAEAARRGGTRPMIAGAHMEGPFLGRRHGAHPSAHVLAPDASRVAALHDIVRVVTLGPESEGALEAIRSLAARGVLVSLGHSDADIDLSRAAVDAGARLVTHVFNAMGPLHHREPGLAGLALADDRVAVSVIADLVHIHPAVLRIVARSKLRGSLVLVTDAVAWPADRGPDADAPRLPDGTLAGSDLTMDRAVRNLVGVGAEITATLEAASTTPARLLGLDDRGVLAVGARADLVALDDQLRVEGVWIGGERVRD